MPFTKISSNTYRSPSGRKFTKQQVKMYYATDGFTKKKKPKARVEVNNKMKGSLGRMNTKTNRIEINIKAHKGDRSELASTVKHELMHVKHPQMTEKEVYKRTAKTKIQPAEREKLIAKLRRKSLNYKAGAIKRKLGIKRNEKTEPGTLIRKAKAVSKKTRLDIAALI